MPSLNKRNGIFDRVVSVYGEWRFTIVMCVLLWMICVLPLFERMHLQPEKFQAFLALLLLFAIFTLSYDRKEKFFALLFGIPTIAISQLGFFVNGDLGKLAVISGEFLTMLFLFGATWLVVQNLMRNKSVNFDTICGAVSGYLFLGMAWGRLFLLLNRLQPGSFEVHFKINNPISGDHLSPLLLTYYSFVVLTTVGFGDITPLTDAAKSFTVIEAVSGQFYMAAIVGSLVSALVTEKQRHQKPHE